MLKVKFKKANQAAITPFYAKDGDAGMDLTAVSKSVDEFGNLVYDTGLMMEIPEGYVGLIFPRSSVSKQDLLLSNSVGVIDSGYRGSILVKFKPAAYYVGGGHPELALEYNVGDRIAQIVIIPYPKVVFIESEELSETERGQGGFGSTN